MTRGLHSLSTQTLRKSHGARRQYETFRGVFGRQMRGDKEFPSAAQPAKAGSVGMAPESQAGNAILFTLQSLLRPCVLTLQSLLRPRVLTLQSLLRPCVLTLKSLLSTVSSHSSLCSDPVSPHSSLFSGPVSVDSSLCSGPVS